MLRRLIFTLGLGIAGLALLAAPAAAQQYPETPPVDVLPDEVDNEPPAEDVDEPPAEDVDDDETEVAGDVVSRRSLPVTGGDLLGLAAIGAGAVAVGGVLVAQRRRTTN